MELKNDLWYVRINCRYIGSEMFLFKTLRIQKYGYNNVNEATTQPVLNRFYKSFSNHHEDGAPGEGSTPSGCCSR